MKKLGLNNMYILLIVIAHMPLCSFDINSNEAMIAAGTELVVSEAKLMFFDTRQTKQMAEFVESHNDDITHIQCHPTIPTQLISASTDGLVCNYSVEQFDEDEAILSVINSGSSVNRAGYFGPNSEYVYCLTHIETLSLHSIEVSWARHPCVKGVYLYLNMPFFFDVH